MSYGVQFKIDPGPNVPWEDTYTLLYLPEWVIKPLTPTMLNEMASQLSGMVGREVRWNYEGSQQGHYIVGPGVMRLHPKPLKSGYECDYGACPGINAPVAYLEYEADMDLEYSLEHGGYIYNWCGFVCMFCLPTAVSWAEQHPPVRWRVVEPWRVKVKPVDPKEPFKWQRIIPDWSTSREYQSDGTMSFSEREGCLISPAWIKFWQEQIQKTESPVFNSPYDDYSGLNGTAVHYILPIFHATKDFDQEVLPMFEIYLGSERILAYPEELFEDCKTWRHSDFYADGRPKWLVQNENG